MADGESWSVNNCVNCANMNLNDRCSYDTSKAWCGYYRQYFSPTDRACSGHFIYDASRESSSSSCYLTTITCEILGYEDDCSTLQTLRMFREEVLKKDEKYHDLLCEYDWATYCSCNTK